MLSNASRANSPASAASTDPCKRADIVQFESVVDPKLPILDAHIHLWPTGKEHPLGRPYLAPELAADTTAGHHVSGVIYVECSSNYRQSGPEYLRPLGETEWLRKLMDRGDASMIRGVVGYVEPSAAESFAEVLDGHTAAMDSLFKGVRCGAAWDPSPLVHNAAHSPRPGLLLADNTHSLLKKLASRNLTFDTWVYFHQLGELCELARRCPDTQIILDHLGGPVAAGPYAGRRAEVLRDWRKGLASLAEYENVTLKLGGIGFQPFMEPGVNGLGTSSQALADYWRRELLDCIELFGPDRCMFESNFPVDSTQCNYVTLWNVYKRVTEDLSATERQALFHDTAANVYQIDHEKIPG